MRRILLTAIAALLSTHAFAADYAPPQPVLRGALPAADKGIDWSGFYVGGTGSFASISTNAKRNTGSIDPSLEKLVRGFVVESGVRALPLVETGRTQDNRIGYGAVLGYNWVFEDVVLGFEADYTRAKLEGGAFGSRTGRVGGNVAATQYDFTATTNRSFKITDYGSVRGRVGYAWDNWLPFLTGGLAYARGSSENSASIASIQRTYDVNGVITDEGPSIYNPSSLREGSRAKAYYGYALGAGIDVALSQNIFVRAEVQHLRFANIGGASLQLNQAKIAAGIKY